MTKNPFINASAAALYIVVVSTVLFYGPKGSGEDTVAAPIALLSLFTLSAAVMGYLFLYPSVQLYLEGRKSASAKLLGQTIGVFGLITAVALAVLFSGLIS
jgi:hypothetical protein